MGYLNVIKLGLHQLHCGFSVSSQIPRSSPRAHGVPALQAKQEAQGEGAFMAQR